MVSRRNALAGQQPFVLFLISYWLLSEALDQMKFIIESVADARERFLKPGGGIIPQSADTLLLPFSADSFGVGRLVATGPANGRSFYDLD